MNVFVVTSPNHINTVVAMNTFDFPSPPLSLRAFYLCECMAMDIIVHVVSNESLKKVPIPVATVFLFVCMFETSSAALWFSTLSDKLNKVNTLEGCTLFLQGVNCRSNWLGWNILLTGLWQCFHWLTTEL